MSVNRLKKLRAMSPREIVHRLAYGAVTAIERRAHARGALGQDGRLRVALAPSICKKPQWAEMFQQRCGERRFFAWEDDPDAVRELFRTRYRQELQRSREIADAVARHEIAFFGETFRFGPEINWHADPVTGAEWPKRYHRDVPVEGGNRGFGDVKYVWELNRHQFLVDLAKVAFLDRSQPHADALAALLESWRQAVPYATGAPWACALEPAFRAWSWMWAYRMVCASGLLERQTHLLWLTALYDHARFLNRHLERYASPYNHLIGEASALFALGLLLEDLSEAQGWVRRGQAVLESTVAGQFHPDGGSVEQSTFYHHATLGFYLLSAILARRNGTEVSSNVLHAIERGVEFSMLLMQPDNRTPRIGGADDGKPIRLEHLPFWDFRPYQAIGAVLFSRPDFRFAASRFWEDALWLLGADGCQAFDRLGSREPARAATFSSSGYFVVRSDWTESGDYLCFDCGPQAAGLRRDDVPSAAHGHADCLSVIATLAGHPVLVDPGLYCYNGPVDWEVHFRKTAAHNTISIDGRDQARHISKMAWTQTYEADFEGSSPEAALGWARGSHDGYAVRGGGVMHRRTVWLRDGGYVVIYDELTGGPGHTARANYQFAPGMLVFDAPGTALFADRFELSWNCSVPARATLVLDGPSPADGWIAPSLGVRQRAPRLVLDFDVCHERVVLVSILADRQRARERGRRRVSFGTPQGLPPSAILGAVVQGPDWEDRLVAGTGGRPVDWHGITTDASVALVRVSQSGAQETHQIGGSYVRVLERAVAEGSRS